MRQPDSLVPLHLPQNVHAVLTPILVGMALGLVGVCAASFFTLSRGELAVPIGLFVAAGLALHFVRRAQVRAASMLLVASLLVGGVTGIYAYGSIRTLANLSLVGAVVVAGIFLDRRALVATLGVTIALVWALIFAEMRGIMVSLNRPIGPFHGLVFTTGLLLIALALHYSQWVAAEAFRGRTKELEERRQAEAVARHAEERLRLSMEATRQGWFELDVPSGRVTASSQFARLIGAGTDQLAINLTMWTDNVHRDDRQEVLDEFAACLASGDTRQMEYRLRAHAGDWRWVRSIARVVDYDADGRPLRMTGTHADITEHVRAREALHESEERYRALVEHLPVGVLVHAHDHVLYANPSAAQLLGAASSDDLVGALVYNFVHPDLRASERAIGLSTQATGLSSPRREVRVLRRDGSEFVANVQGVRVTYEGQPAIQVSFEDLSDRKRAEESRLRSQNLESLGTLAGGIAHDFNNILSAIRGNAELALEDLGDSHPSVESLTEIQRAGARASELIRRITAFGRPKEPKRDLVELPLLVQEVLKLLRPTMPAGIAMSVHFDADAPRVLADAAQVHEAIVNLTTNAAHAIGDLVGTVDFVVDTAEVAATDAAPLRIAPGRYARLTVRDSGRGMDAVTMARMFDVFFTTKPVGEGTGLGLSMVYGIMQSHHGAIAAESTVGRGSSFFLYFPAADADAVLAPAPAAAAPATRVSRRVLYVDDEAPLVTLAERSLARLGHRVFAFTNPLLALDAFRAQPDTFDVVVTDLSMPHMSGLELARAVRAIRADVPLVLITGFLRPEHQAEARDIGIETVTIKASTGQDAARVIDEVLQSRGAPATGTHRVRVS